MPSLKHKIKFCANYMPVKSDVWVVRDEFIELNIHNGSCDVERGGGVTSSSHVKINNRDFNHARHPIIELNEHESVCAKVSANESCQNITYR
jgi:hypothetical protein